ncbi:YtrH family sporulation protein [Pseudalkalibacillus berkeleyi]|uniref:YtrH family sporulation protein n=1 Tax=Pseudalkalibacillus berkeleyi TaxID=1069813 RepID=A0ABS9H2L4_9BACL|nr:YtrH family sporulation protein [Pseudalkalibacillus berkeleyi]MCF6138210.1 YtrH family sporulation protein [Pseudalkalibacillus berkeleyi]
MVVRDFVSTNIIYFFVAFGIIIGGCLIGAIGMMFVGRPPFQSMILLSKSLKIWAIVAAIGGTFDTIDKFESSLFSGSILEVINQCIYIIAALIGANTGEAVIRWMTQGVE